VKLLVSRSQNVGNGVDAECKVRKIAWNAGKEEGREKGMQSVLIVIVG
jgi:hypothetical protein